MTIRFVIDIQSLISRSSQILKLFRVTSKRFALQFRRTTSGIRGYACRVTSVE